MRCFIAMLFLSAVAGAQPQAAEVLAKVAQRYAHLHALHVVATQKESISTARGVAMGEADYELAEGPPGEFRAWTRSGDVEGLSVSDGNTTWKALPKAKQWMMQEVAGTAGDDDEAASASAGGKESGDLRQFVSRMLVLRFVALAQLAESPQIVREDVYSLDRAKVPCYVIRARTPGCSHEIWVDKDRLVVLREIQTSRTGSGLDGGSIETRVKKLELDEAVDNSLFTWTPEKKWKEVESLVLPRERPAALTGTMAADFQLKSVSGDAVRLSGLRGSVVVLDFWATWCGPCRAELPIVDKLRDEFAGKVRFFGVNDEDSGTVARFLKKNQYELPVLMDNRKSVHRDYSVRAIPTLFVIGPDGVIRRHFIGGLSESELRKAIQAALGGA